MRRGARDGMVTPRLLGKMNLSGRAPVRRVPSPDPPHHARRTHLLDHRRRRRRLPRGENHEGRHGPRHEHRRRHRRRARRRHSGGPAAVREQRRRADLEHPGRHARRGDPALGRQQVQGVEGRPIGLGSPISRATRHLPGRPRSVSGPLPLRPCARFACSGPSPLVLALAACDDDARRPGRRPSPCPRPTSSGSAPRSSARPSTSTPTWPSWRPRRPARRLGRPGRLRAGARPPARRPPPVAGPPGQPAPGPARPVRLDAGVRSAPRPSGWPRPSAGPATTPPPPTTRCAPTAVRGSGSLDARLAAFRRRPPSPTRPVAGCAPADSLAADRARLDARLGAYPDTSDAQFPPFRQSITDGVLALERRADALAADTTRAARHAAASPARRLTEADGRARPASARTTPRRRTRRCARAWNAPAPGPPTSDGWKAASSSKAVIVNEPRARSSSI